MTTRKTHLSSIVLIFMVIFLVVASSGFSCVSAETHQRENTYYRDENQKIISSRDIPFLLQKIEHLQNVVHQLSHHTQGTTTTTPAINSHTLFSLSETNDTASNCTCPEVCEVCKTEEELCAPPPIDWADPMIYLKLGGTVVLVLLSGFCAGETTALLGLDLNTLDILAKSDPNPKNRKYARRIIPIRRNGNLLLITLIIANVFVNSAISILSADLTSGLLGFFLSSALIVLFGEIIPQAVCVKFTLPIAANTTFIIYTFMFFLFPISYPLSLILNTILAQEMGQYFDKAGLKHLIDLHAQSHDKTGLEMDAANIVHGALDFATKKVVDVMTPFKHLYCADVSSKLDATLMNDIWSHGHSRVPIYKGTKDNIVAILHVKDICVLNADDELPLSTVCLFYGKEPLFVDPQLDLSQMLQFFKAGRIHMAIVQEPTVVEEGKDPIYKTVGLITLEDVIEEILREEIVDESDRYVSNLHEERVGGHNTRVNPMMDFRLGLDSLTKRLTPNQIQSATQFLQRTSKYFQMLPPDYLKQLLGKSRIITMKPREKEDIYLYKKGEPVEFCSLVIGGRLEVTASSEEFTTYLGPWSLVGVSGLIQENHICDFSAKVVDECSVLRIFRTDFMEEVLDLCDRDEHFYLPEELNWIKPEVDSDHENAIDIQSVHFVVEDENGDRKKVQSPKRIPKTLPPPAETANKKSPGVSGGRKSVRKSALLSTSATAQRSSSPRSSMRRSRSGLSQLKSLSEDSSPNTPLVAGDHDLIPEDIFKLDAPIAKDESKPTPSERMALVPLVEEVEMELIPSPQEEIPKAKAAKQEAARSEKKINSPETMQVTTSAAIAPQESSAEKQQAAPEVITIERKDEIPEKEKSEKADDKPSEE
eukprot:CAMPEP_0117439860 /NCGR_PEP_ID=MMETSP0759-20121206/2779_1 /TAXON_ID=63605 /ORGANISM="Percolomonas cosmopolitus, Strain WS" /LENGTH=875 /DNA_ID=CAMNT_0005231581 /DNA_START=191 /DNA_END=2818 /DNA_ORIENTATION=+